MGGVSPGQIQPLVTERIKAGRNFCNKLWNIGRFVDGLGQDNNPTIADDWIRRQQNRAIQLTKEAFEDYNLNEAYEIMYRFVWNDLADWYLEVAKHKPNQTHCRSIVEAGLILAHPWMPFVSEAVYQQLNPNTDQLLINQLFPEDKTV